MTRVVGLGEALERVHDGATIATNGFTLMGVAEAVVAGIEERFLATGHPRDLIVVHAAGQSNRVIGFEHFAHEGLVRRIVGSHWGLMPKMGAFLHADRAEAVCLPQGQISHLFRAIAAGRPGNLTRIGLGTFIDPRQLGGKVNARARAAAPDYVELHEVGGSEYLLYKAFPIDVGIIRATEADEDGNCTLDDEAVILDALAIAQAAHNSGGVVICQVKRLVRRGSLHPKRVAIPGPLVDFVVVAPSPESEHRMTHSLFYDGAFTGDWKSVEVALPAVEPGPRKVIGRRAVHELRTGDIVNIGTGIPGDTIGPILAEQGRLHDVTLTVESGTYGGVPAGGVDFGIAANPFAIISHPDQFNFYDGGGLDITFMGAGQIDGMGNVNVSTLGERSVGAGGFIDITQAAKRVVFCLTFTSGGLEARIDNGRLSILAEGKHDKFVRSVDQITFSGAEAARQGQQVLYVTERAVFRLEDGRLQLVEVAPGVDLRREVLDRMGAEVVVPAHVAMMAPDLFDVAGSRR